MLIAGATAGRKTLCDKKLFMKYQKKPIVIEAFRYGIDYRPDWFTDKVSSLDIVTADSHCEIRTLEGIMRGEKGDWIIKGIKGEIYPCKPDVFEKSYDTVPVDF